MCDDVFDIGNSLQMMLMEISRNFGWKCMQRLNELEIQPRQLPVLITIANREGISQKTLAEVLHNTPPTVNVSVQRLEKAGLVSRQRDQKDQRKIHVMLTDQGRKLINSLKESMKQLEGEMFQGFSEKELLEVRGYFERMMNNIEKIPGEACPENPLERKEKHFD